MPSDELIKRILKDVGKMPPLPDVLTMVMQMTKDPDVSASQMNKVISMDQALTANILKLCNSAYYGLPRVISSVTQAVMYLGFHTVRNLVMTCTLQDSYASQLQGYGYPEGGLWKHSVSVAIASQVLCKKIRPGLNDTAFTAGLLHDLGKTILNKHVGGRFQEIAVLMQEKNILMHEAEAEIFGFDHAIIGAKIADQWNFPPELVQAIGFHHYPDKAKGHPLLPAIVNMGDMLSISLGAGSNIQLGQSLEPSSYTREALGKVIDKMEPLLEEIGKALADASLFMTPNA